MGETLTYQISQSEADRLGALFAGQYDEAAEKDLKNMLVSRANDKGTLALYAIQDAYASLRSKSKDSFFLTFRAKAKQEFGRAFGNKYDVAAALLGIAEAALDKLVDKIKGLAPPGLDTAIGKAYSAGKDAAMGKAKDSLNAASMGLAGEQLARVSGSEPPKLLTDDKAAGEAAKNAVMHYKQIGRFIGTMPRGISSFDDLITFPKAAWDVRAVASHLAIDISELKRTVDWMEDRLVEVRQAVKGYQHEVGKNMPNAVKNVLNLAYGNGYAKGVQDLAAKKYHSVSVSKSPELVKDTGAPTQMAVYLAHATLQGYYDSGNKVLSNPTLTSAGKGGFNFGKNLQQKTL